MQAEAAGEFVKIGIAVASAASAVISGYVALTVKASIASLETRLAEQRSADKEELKQWINGSFMRSREVDVRLHESERRVSVVERLCGECKARIRA